MSRFAAAGTALINEDAFLRELERFERADEACPVPADEPSPALDDDPFAALDQGMEAAETAPLDSTFDAQIDALFDPPVDLPIESPADPPIGSAVAPTADPPFWRGAPSGDALRIPPGPPAPARLQVPYVAAAIVLAACVTAGAATAAFVFHDRVMQITATRTATP